MNRINSIADALRKNERAKGKSLSSSGAQQVAGRTVERRFEMIDGAINAIDNASGVVDTVGALLGMKIGHAKVVAITSPEFRTFALSWHFVPRSFQESLQIQKICYNLRKNMTPELTNNVIYVAKFPSVYTMFFQPNTKFLYKFKPCVLTSTTVSYNTGGVPSFYKQQDSNPQFSPPESVRLDTTWLELDYFVQQHYENDHNNTEDLPSNDPYGLLKDSFTFSG